MSLDLSWPLLDEAFTADLLGKLNVVLSNASRPEYIGPITLSDLKLGNEAPEINIVDVGDVWQEFLERDEIALAGLPQERQERTFTSSAGTSTNDKTQAVRRDGHLARFADKNLPFSAVRSPVPGSSLAEQDTHQQRKQNRAAFQSYRQYSDSGQMHRIDTGSVFSSEAPSSVPPSPWAAGLSYAGTPHHHGGGMTNTGPGSTGYFSAWPGGLGAGTSAGPAGYIHPNGRVRSVPSSRRSSWQRLSRKTSQSQTYWQQQQQQQQQQGLLSTNDSASLPPYLTYVSPPPPLPMPNDEPSSTSASSLPSLQLQFSTHWTTQSLRLTLDTSLLINNPSPAFMSLPLTITITGLSLAAGGLLAFEVDPITNVRRTHFCLLVEEEEGDEEGQEENTAAAAAAAGVSNVTPQQQTQQTPTTLFAQQQENNARALKKEAQQSISSPGERILYNLTLETSVGQADKHVLKNVAKVERFVVQLVRKAIGDELVFPNFYSVELPS